MTQRLYLDHNATTPLCEWAREAMRGAMDVCGNASSVHADGRAQSRIVEDAREAVAALLSVGPANVVFTSGGSEANNTVLKGFAGSVLCSSIEHSSVLDARADADHIGVTADGVVDLDALRSRLSAVNGRQLVSIMAANNETGVIQPLADVAAIAKEFGAALHVDAIQAAGKLALHEIASLADVVSISAHKIGGPAGIGALILRDGFVFEPLISGGGQERRRRAGTENVIGIAGFGAAARSALDGLDTYAGVADVRDFVESALAGEAEVYGARVERLANTTSIRMPGVSSETQVMAFDLAGISLSAGSACSSGKIEASHVLRAMGLTEQAAGETIRVSFGAHSTRKDAQTFVEAWRKIYARAAVEAA